MERAKPEPPAQSVTATIKEEDCELSHEDCIQALVTKHSVVVFSKPWCPYCKKALETLAVEGVVQEPYLHVVSLEDPRTSSAVQDALAILTGRRTVPNVFVGGISIGGGDETVTLHREGKLRSMLIKAKAFPLPDPKKNFSSHGQRRL